MSEIAVVTARKSRLQDLANKGSARARGALDLANHPSRFLSTVQIGITLVGILAGAFGGGKLTDAIATQLEQVPVMVPYSRSIGLGIVVLSITYFSVVLGELVPKRLALRHPEPLAMVIAPLMRFLLKICSPIVYLLAFSSDLIVKLFGGKRPHEEVSVTEEEITTLVRQGREAGLFEETEQEMVEAVFELGDKSARGLMTPRTQIIWLDRQ